LLLYLPQITGYSLRKWLVVKALSLSIRCRQIPEKIVARANSHK